MALMSKHPTYTGLVYEHLCEVDDLRCTAQVASVTGVTLKHTSTALHMLLHYKAVEKVEDNGVDYWFATPQLDQRGRVIKETTTHTRRVRRPRFIETVRGAA